MVSEDVISVTIGLTWILAMLYSTLMATFVDEEVNGDENDPALNTIDDKVEIGAFIHFKSNKSHYKHKNKAKYHFFIFILFLSYFYFYFYFNFILSLFYFYLFIHIPRVIRRV